MTTPKYTDYLFHYEYYDPELRDLYLNPEDFQWVVIESAIRAIDRKLDRSKWRGTDYVVFCEFQETHMQPDYWPKGRLYCRVERIDGEPFEREVPYVEADSK